MGKKPSCKRHASMGHNVFVGPLAGALKVKTYIFFPTRPRVENVGYPRTWNREIKGFFFQIHIASRSGRCMCCWFCRFLDRACRWRVNIHVLDRYYFSTLCFSTKGQSVRLGGGEETIMRAPSRTLIWCPNQISSQTTTTDVRIEDEDHF